MAIWGWDAAMYQSAPGTSRSLAKAPLGPDSPKHSLPRDQASDDTKATRWGVR
jgi:hypothetical protein